MLGVSEVVVFVSEEISGRKREKREKREKRGRGWAGNFILAWGGLPKSPKSGSSKKLNLLVFQL